MFKYIKAKQLVISIAIIYSCNSFTQSSLDSLTSLWMDVDLADTVRLKALYQLTWDGYLFSNPDSAFHYAQEYYHFALEIEHKESISNGLFLMGACCVKTNKYTQAIDYYTQSLQMEKELGNLSKLSRMLDRLGNLYWNIGDYEIALDKMHQSLAIDTKLGNNFGIANSLKGIGLIHWSRGAIDLAIDYYQQSMIFDEKINNKLGLANTLNNLGNAFWKKGDLEESKVCYNKSFQLGEELDNKFTISSSLNGLGLIHFIQGEFEQALQYHFKSLSIREQEKNLHGEAYSLHNIGLIYWSTGDLPKAYEYYSRSLKLREEIGDKAGIASSIHGIGLIYEAQGNTSLALDFYNRSLKIKETIGDKSGVAAGFTRIGLVNYEFGDLSSALTYFSKANALNEEIGSKSELAYSLKNIGLTYSAQNDFEKAIEYFNKSLEIHTELGNSRGASAVLNDLGEVYFQQGDYTASISLSKRSYELALEIGLPMESKNAVRSLYLSMLKTQNEKEALAYLSKLRLLQEASIETNYFTFAESEKQAYFQLMEADFERYYDFTASYHTKFSSLTDTCYNLALKNKGLSLKSSTAMRQAIQESNDSVLIRQYENWINMKKKLTTMSLEDSLYKTLEIEANLLERRLVKSSTIFSDFEKVKNIDWKSVRSGLKPNEAAIEFVHFKSDIDTANPIIYAALIVKKNSQHPEMIQLCTEAELKEILGTFQGNNLTFVNDVYGTRSKAKSALYQKIWSPLEQHLDDIQKIYYSPSGLLHKVSFAVISKDNNVFLCDNYQLHQQSSTGKLALSTPMIYDAKDEFLLIGGVQYNSDKTVKEVWNFLPGTERETENIQAYLKKKNHAVNFYSASNASESNFKLKAKQANILHISTHGFFFPDPENVREEAKKYDLKEDEINFRGTNELDSSERSSSNYANWSFVINKNPLMRSGLVLAGANDVWQRKALEQGEDGILTAQEVSNIDLQNTKLVVLSACETGLGDIKGSEGVFGLQRAFKMAGAKYIIMSLWQVPDKETTEFMKLFYKRLTKVKDIQQAFHHTQKVMRKKYDPYYWGAFVLVN